MPTQSSQPQGTNLRVKRHRDALRRAGLRPVQLWVPDTRLEGFAEQCRKQSEALHNDPEEEEVLDWIEQQSDDRGWS